MADIYSVLFYKTLVHMRCGRDITYMPYNGKQEQSQQQTTMTNPSCQYQLCGHRCHGHMHTYLFTTTDKYNCTRLFP